MRWSPLTVILLLGCAPHTHVTRLSPTKHEPAPADALVQLYSQKLPTCPFEELALVTASSGGFSFASSGGLVRALSKRARNLGGHALVGVGFLPHGGMSATVIRFTQDDCKQ